MIQSIPTDGRRMFHLPISLRDAIVGLTIPPLATSSAACHHYHRTEDGSVTRYHQPHDNHRQNRSWNFRQQMSSSASSVSSSATTESMSIIRLLSRPRIVGTASPTSSANNTFYRQSASTAARGGRDMSSLLFPEGGGRIGVRMSDGGGVSCMDLDRGNNVNSFGSSSSSPPRYLLVGSGGGDCSIALYDLSCFGSDAYLYHSTSCSSSSSSSNTNDNSSNNAIISSKNNLSFRSNDPALWTHRPIARSLRQNALSSSNAPENVVNGVPSGHRHPLRGVHWYPGEFIILTIILL